MSNYTWKLSWRKFSYCIASRCPFCPLSFLEYLWIYFISRSPKATYHSYSILLYCNLLIKVFSPPDCSPTTLLSVRGSSQTFIIVHQLRHPMRWVQMLNSTSHYSTPNEAQYFPWNREFLYWCPLSRNSTKLKIGYDE